jgi:F0F1-type ATP synthase membrane subunit c/vacuolar-type H+-ATPase subunit K
MQQQRIILAAIAVSTVIYAFVLYTLHPVPGRPFEESVRAPMTLPLYVAAFAMFVAALVVPNLTRSEARVRMIVSMAMFEACAICGLLAGFLGADWRLYLPPWILAIFGFIRQWPREGVR